MNTFFARVFKYHHQYNRQLIELLAAHRDVLPERSLPLMAHILNAHQIWTARILGLEAFGVFEQHPIGELLDIEDRNYALTSEILEKLNLADTVSYRNSRGESFSNTLEDVLFHVANHTTHHRGQLISDLRQAGIAPPVTDYIFYIREG